MILLEAGSSPVLRGLVEYYWTVHSCPGDKRQTTGASEGNYSQARSRGRLRDFNQPGNAQALKETELAATAFK